MIVASLLLLLYLFLHVSDVFICDQSDILKVIYTYICYIYVHTYTNPFPCFFPVRPPKFTVCFSNFNNEEISPSTQVKHAAEPGGTPCLGDTHESETCNEEAWGRREVGHRDEYIYIYFLVGKGKVLSHDFFLAIIYIYGIIVSIGLPNIERFSNTYIVDLYCW